MGVQNLLLSGVAALGEPAAAVDGEVVPFTFNVDKRLRVATKPGLFDPISGELTVVGNTLVVDTADASNVMVHVKNSGTVTHAAGQYALEGTLDSTNGTDGTWFSVQAVRTNANTVETTTGTLSMVAAAGLVYGWELSVNALKYFRVRCTTNATASSKAKFTVVRGSYATEPIPASQVTGTQGISGTVTANQGTLVTPTASNINSAATTNAAFIKASAGTVYNVSVYNSGASTAYVKLYNQTTAPNLTSAVPVIVIPVPATSTVSQNLGVVGHRFTTGIAIAITGGAADTDTTATAAGQVKVMTSYI